MGYRQELFSDGVAIISDALKQKNIMQVNEIKCEQLFTFYPPVV